MYSSELQARHTIWSRLLIGILCEMFLMMICWGLIGPSYKAGLVWNTILLCQSLCQSAKVIKTSTKTKPHCGALKLDCKHDTVDLIVSIIIFSYFNDYSFLPTSWGKLTLTLRASSHLSLLWVISATAWTPGETLRQGQRTHVHKHAQCVDHLSVMTPCCFCVATLDRM